VRWTAIGAAAVIALVLEAVLVHDWSTSSLREQLAQAQAAAKSATLRGDQLSVDNAALKKDVASITAEAAMLKDTADTLRQENTEITQELATQKDKTKDEMPKGDGGIQSAPNAPSSDTLVNSIGVKLKLIPAGTFTMGEAGSSNESNEKPHRVTLTRPFYMGIHEVTNAQWKQVMGSVPSNWKEDAHPAVGVSWKDAVEFCQKLSALPEERKAGRVYRLPTEAEWEYACRAGTTTQYSFGDDEKLVGDYGWFAGNSVKQTHPVGQKKPNAWGVYDMHGNVWEWCSDWYGDYSDGEVTNPQGPSSGSNRVIRGGSWINSAGHCRSAIRGGLIPSIRGYILGFRLALSPSGVESQEAGK
jgi:formylglycine-generating enzyme required for sulfatase activity